MTASALLRHGPEYATVLIDGTGTGPLNIFATRGQHPRLSRAWLRYSAALMPFGTLPRRDTELVILRVAWRCGCAHEWQQHVPARLMAAALEARRQDRNGRRIQLPSTRRLSSPGRPLTSIARAAPSTGPRMTSPIIRPGSASSV